MKTSLLLITIFLSANVFAQKVISEGTLTYNISIETTKGEKQLASALNGAVLTLFVTNIKSRTEMQSKLGVETTVFDNKANKGFILKEYSGQKLMITTSTDNWNQKNQVSNSLSFIIDNATTTIAGYTCKKATATSADGKNYTVYFDATTSIANKSYNNAFPQLPGLPVQYELQSGNLVFKYTLSKTNTDALVGTKFDAPKAGFRVMTYEENQQLKKGE
jgi:GLPGLI family protein